LIDDEEVSLIGVVREMTHEDAVELYLKGTHAHDSSSFRSASSSRRVERAAPAAPLEESAALTLSELLPTGTHANSIPSAVA
jgi:hypothetical protein